MTKKIVLEKAKELGFIYQTNETNQCEILPKQPEETWKLTESESQWILSVNNVPQLRLNQEAAIAFLVDRDQYR